MAVVVEGLLCSKLCPHSVRALSAALAPQTGMMEKRCGTQPGRIASGQARACIAEVPHKGMGSRQALGRSLWP